MLKKNLVGTGVWPMPVLLVEARKRKITAAVTEKNLISQ
jgi:hypothetical protein